MNRVVLVALAIAMTAFAGASNAQDIDFSKVEIKTIDLGHNTYRLEGQGGNITVAVGADAIIMVDGQFAPLHDKIKAAIAAISPLPIKYLVNTHFHGDHTGGNAGFQKDGAIVAGSRFMFSITGLLRSASCSNRPDWKNRSGSYPRNS